ncbi:hypothetical protein CcI49_26595 [Frankia sp. CcI49]|uniref:DUF58 domain-containing protein n=1 Tax=Frankia sp. CcI49 TaxID=1745382 RepID=UPI0009754B43|nr:DUF58 domain-containing protein [Frankia sp. CcI49]ONH57003.1 hypothetical protein CcI49_26595 [Frankia sp. CcI49]
MGSSQATGSTRITGSGVAMAAATAVLIAAGLVLDYPELLALGLVAGVALLCAAGWMTVTPDVTLIREIHPPSVFQGDGARALVTVTNAARRRSPPILAAETVGEQTVAVALPSLAPGARFQAAYPLPTDRRGVFEVGPLVVGHTDPLRLLHVGRAFPDRSTLRVHPRIHTVDPLPTGGSPDMDGPTSATSPLGGVAFHSLREYVRGDDLRLIHWRSTARTGKMMVRHNVVPNEPRMTVVLDTSAAPYAGDYFEDAVRVAASLAVSGAHHGFPVELWTTGGRRGAAESSRDVAGLLDLLAAVAPADDDPGLAELTRMTPGEDGMVLGVVTGQPPGARLGAVSAVRSRFAMASVVCVGEEHGRPGLPVRGALTVNVRTSDDFAAVWNSWVRR